MNQDYLEIVRSRFGEPLDQLLIDAILGGEPELVQRAILNGGNPNANGEYGKTPLAVAVIAQQKQSFLTLLENGSDPNHRTPNGATPAAEAIQCRDGFYLTALLDAGLDPNIKNGNTPLIFLAVRSGYRERYQSLVANGADLSAKTGSGHTLASTLINVSWYDELMELVLNDGDFRSPSGKAGTPAQQLIEKQNRFGGDTNADSFMKRVEILKLMQEKGISLPDGVPGI